MTNNDYHFSLHDWVNAFAGAEFVLSVTLPLPKCPDIPVNDADMI